MYAISRAAGDKRWRIEGWSNNFMRDSMTDCWSSVGDVYASGSRFLGTEVASAEWERLGREGAVQHQQRALEL